MRAAGAMFWMVAGLLTGPTNGRVAADEPIEAPLGRLEVTRGSARFELPRLPAIDELRVESTPTLGLPFLEDPHGRQEAYLWTTPAEGPAGFFRVRLDPLSPEALLAAVALNRVAYGPTPDLLDRVVADPAAYLDQQLTPETLVEDLDAPVPALDWQFVSLTGVASSSTLYVYPSAAGEVYLDDLALVAGSAPEQGANLVKNGGFEAPLAGTWTVSDNLAGSERSPTVKRAGQSSLHLVASSGGDTRDSSLWQQLAPALKVGQTYTLSYWCSATGCFVGVVR